MCDTLGILAWKELSARREKLRAERLATAGESGVLSRGYMALGFIESQPEMMFLYQQIQRLNPPRGETGPPLMTPQDELANISVPMLFIVGSEDPVLDDVHAVERYHSCAIPLSPHSPPSDLPLPHAAGPVQPQGLSRAAAEPTQRQARSDAA